MGNLKFVAPESSESGGVRPRPLDAFPFLTMFSAKTYEEKGDERDAKTRKDIGKQTLHGCRIRGVTATHHAWPMDRSFDME